MTGYVDRLVQQAREARLRKSLAYDAVMNLPLDERREVLAELILRAEADEADEALEKAPAAAASSTTTTAKTATFTDKAEAFVLAHPDGVKTAAVAKAIGQDVSSVDGSLRSTLKRGTVARRGGLWVPATAPVVAPPAKTEPKPDASVRVTIRDLILRVYAETGNKPIGAAALFEALKAIQPSINKSSLDGELNRMRTSSLLVQDGVGQNGGGLYKLTQEASTRPA